MASDEWRSKQQDITDYLQNCIASDPGWSAPVLLLAGLYERLEDFSRVENICRQALARNPSATLIANRLLTLLEKQGRFSEAEQVLKNLRQINADPRLTSAWRVRMALFARGQNQDRERALEILAVLEEGSPQDPELMKLRAMQMLQERTDLYRLSGDMSQAEQWIEHAEATDPTSQTVVHARFLWLVGHQRYDELAQISSAYISAEEQNPTTVMAAASILATLNSIELKKEGVKLFEHVVTLSPTLLSARLGLASTLYQTGNIERAEKVYRDSLEQDPYNAQILNDLAWILQERDQDYDAALELANKGLSIDRDDTDLRHLLDTRGAILSKLERFADAKNDFERLAELSPPDTRQQANALLQLGRICAKLNEPIEAKQHLERALEIDQKVNAFTTDERSEIIKITQGSVIQTVSKGLTSNRIGSDKR